VVGLIKNANLEFPFDFKKYFQERYEGDKEYRSKLDLCLMIIKRAVSCFGKDIYVLFDSWYAAAKVINKLLCCITQRRKMATATHLFSPIVFQFT